jgi:ribonuclease P protein component
MFAFKNRTNKFKASRVGITASKKVGGAVVRNRARRVIREAWREFAARILCGFDIVIVARAGMASSNPKTKDIQREIFFAAKKLNIVSGKKINNFVGKNPG